MSPLVATTEFQPAVGVYPLAQPPSLLQVWQQFIDPKLTQLLQMLGSQSVARNLALAQVWTYLPVLTQGKQMLSVQQVCLLGDAEFSGFHSKCYYEGVLLSELGPMGKVWESGAVHVVQDAENLACDAHPCNKMTDALSERAGEITYIPVYDSTGSAQGIVAVLELVVSRRSDDVMVVANIISCVAELMGALQLSLSNPKQEAAACKMGTGRHSAPPACGLQHAGAAAGPTARPFGSGGSLARTASMHALQRLAA